MGKEEKGKGEHLVFCCVLPQFTFYYQDWDSGVKWWGGREDMVPGKYMDFEVIMAWGQVHPFLNC